jgi:DNA polymerase-3 subunit delta'
VQAAIGSHPDLITVARLPNRTDVLIEQVRDLILRLGMKPARAPLRIAIIDDAETLNAAGQNALLKTLEEPPGHALIFIVTASERALLDTVRSRARPVRFAPLAPAHLEAILRARTDAPPERIGAAARLARGSAARALALAAGEAPPMLDLLRALAEAEAIDYPAASRLGQEHFAAREAAAENFELIARLLEEILVSKLSGSEVAQAAADAAGIMKQIGTKLSTAALVDCIESAVRAREAIEAMANPRLQAEQWWLGASRAARSG